MIGTATAGGKTGIDALLRRCTGGEGTVARIFLRSLSVLASRPLAVALLATLAAPPAAPAWLPAFANSTAAIEFDPTAADVDPSRRFVEVPMRWRWARTPASGVREVRTVTRIDCVTFASGDVSGTSFDARGRVVRRYSRPALPDAALRVAPQDSYTYAAVVGVCRYFFRE